jgi:hypothetical protein
MTEPTDAEISALYAEQTGFDLNESPAALMDFARAVLAKWGTPAGAGEVVAWRRPDKHGGFEYEDGITSFEHDPTAEPLYTAPQPTQAQAGAVPPIECSTEELKRAYAFGWWSALEKQREALHAGAVPLTPEQIKDEASHHGFIGSTEMLVKFVRGIEAAHGIKGGQHGL